MSTGRPGDSTQQSGHCLGEQVHAELDQLSRQRPGGVRRQDRQRRLGEDRAGVNLRGCAMQADPGHRRAVGDRPVHGLRSAIRGKQAWVDVEPAVPGEAERARSDDLIEARHHHAIETELIDREARVLVVDPPGADQRDAEMVGDAAQRVVAEDGRVCSGGGDDPDRLHVELEQPEEERQAEVGREAGERHARAGACGDDLGRGREIAIGDEGEDLACPEVAANGIEVRRVGCHLS